MTKLLSTCAAILFTLTVTIAYADSGSPLALIYKGPGAKGGSDAVATVALLAGYQPVFVGPDGTEAIGKWNQAALWIQPGGQARKQVVAMSAQLKSEIRDFVHSGNGGYVGFCAGGFLAMEKFGWHNDNDPSDNFESDAALGLLPGYGHYYDHFDKLIPDAKHTGLLISTVWAGQPRKIYWDLGPYFDEDTVKSPGVEVLSRYEDGPAMTIRSTYGKGRVFVSGVHPEAPQDWFDGDNLKNDSLNYDLAETMFHWADPSNLTR
jgi:glutamine amidotransferase-like uncharacterized protein